MRRIMLCVLFAVLILACEEQQVIVRENEPDPPPGLEPPDMPEDNEDSIALKPNIILVIMDDLRYDALGIVQRRLSGMGRFHGIETPHLDAMAEHGALFNNAFVTTSLCSPSRASILTGLYTRNHRIKGNHKPFTDPTFAFQLRDNGYHTAYFGKWHMGEQSGKRPGFDYSYSFVGQGIYDNPEFEENGEPQSTEGWVDRISTDKMLSYLEGHVATDKQLQPFCAVLGFKSCHGPWHFPTEDTYGLYNDYETVWVPSMEVIPPYPTYYLTFDRYDKQFTWQDRNYLRYLWVIDQQMGKIQEFLKHRDLLRNTYLIFMSDNGYYFGEHQQRDKRSAYEESLRIPLIVQGPNVPHGIDIDEMVLNVDIAPTLLGIANVDPQWEMDGKDMQSLWLGDKSSWRSSIFYEYYEEPQGPPSIFAHRNARFKLVHYPLDPTWDQFFDLENDPYETQNLYTSGQHVDVLNKMQAELEAWVSSGL